MEGKGVLFKRFADIDVFDIDIDAKEVDKICTVVKALEPTFGGINLEDIKAPECFVIEERLKKEMKIPVFHDDQHGTAIISGAALLNALELAGKKIDEVKVVVSGAGAAAIACTKFYLTLGVKRENVMMVDTKGVVYKGRTEGMNQYKAGVRLRHQGAHAGRGGEGRRRVPRLLGEGHVHPGDGPLDGEEPHRLRARQPRSRRSATPTRRRRATTSSWPPGARDYPNQVNNVLGFPYIFRGALDVRAKAITEEMKMAAARALAALAEEDVPESVSRAYGGEKFRFGRDYIIPKPLDPRVLLWVAPAVAKAAMDGGVARVQLDLDEYRERLRKMQSRVAPGDGRGLREGPAEAGADRLPRGRTTRRSSRPPQILREEGICEPILLGPVDAIRESIEEQRLDDARRASPSSTPRRARTSRGT